MGGVSRNLPAEIPEMPFNGQAREAGLQNFRRLCGFLWSPQLSEGRRPQSQHLKMSRIQVQGFARPGQRSIILSQKVVTKPDHCSQLIPRVAVAARRRG